MLSGAAFAQDKAPVTWGYEAASPENQANLQKILVQPFNASGKGDLTIDFRGNDRLPVISYPFDVANPNGALQIVGVPVAATGTQSAGSALAMASSQSMSRPASISAFSSGRCRTRQGVCGTPAIFSASSSSGL